MFNFIIFQVLVQVDLLVDCFIIDKVIVVIVDVIVCDYKGEVLLFLLIMYGVLLFVGQLVLELGVCGQDVQFDYLYVICYRGEIIGGDLVWKYKLVILLFGCCVLLVDDIFDEGYILQGVCIWCLEQGVIDVCIVVMIVKKYDCVLFDVIVDYVGIELLDCYVFGFGMDVNEILCCVLVIYVMKE